MDSCRIERSNAAVGEAVESPTPTVERTAREERRPAMLLAKAWRESCQEGGLLGVDRVLWNGGGLAYT
jgi:hypothetical protein